MSADAPASQSTLSAYFKSTPSIVSPRRGKRISSPIDLTGDNEEDERQFKRLRFTGKAPVSSTSASAISNSASGLVDSWRFSPEKPRQAGPSMERSALEKERHEAFKKKLLNDNSSLLKRGAETIDSDHDHPIGDSVNAEDELLLEETGLPSSLRDLLSHSDQGKGKEKGKTAKRNKTTVELGPSGQTYTPLEKQILQLKKDNTGTLLMVEVGYKYKFFGKDAEIASKELGMVAYMDRNFLVASIPVHRRDVHLKKLISRGYRVGIVEQIETAALKKISDNRNGVFVRKLTHLYTATTYVEELDSVDDIERYNAPPFMCLVEERKDAHQADVSIGMITICPSTGDVVWDSFDDTIMRLELETRLVHTRPSELLIPSHGLTEPTNKMLSHFSGLSSLGHQIRTEKFKETFSYTEAFSNVSRFYTDKSRFGAASESFSSGMLMAAITDLPTLVVIALAHAIKYLSTFGLADAFLETRFFTKFTTQAHMLLAANTLINLEIYRNETDCTSRGSLIWVLDRTKTKFGARLLRSWVGRPLVDKRILEERIDAVQEILESYDELLLTLRNLIKGLPDLAKGLSRIQYGQCTPKELSILLPAFRKVALAYDTLELESIGLKSPILKQIICSLPKLKEPMTELMNAVNIKKAAEGKKESMWTDSEKYPAISDAEGVSAKALGAIDEELKDELKSIRKLLKTPSLEWTTVAADECLVVIKKSDKIPIPDNWILHSKTKFLARYYTPSVRAKLDERAQYYEILEAESNKAYRSFLKDISENYYGIMRDAINKLATADCLLSLAQVALQEKYVRPQFTDDDALEIIDGRHPIIEAFSDNPYIPNTIRIGGEHSKTKIITGPNMGGKSSCVRMVALIALMAQIGSYVPATSVKMGLLDSILTRMGASDDLARGRSTFMVEMSETSEILQTATSRSLVILDELGRGTSTFDGMAIADATLQYLVQSRKSKTLFITHYPLLATRLETKFPRDIQNLHMGYESEMRIDGTRDITFLYRLVTGLATESFGIECARSAKIPTVILGVAAERAAHMQEEVQGRMRRNKLGKAPYLVQKCLENTGVIAKAALGDLQTTLETL